MTPAEATCVVEALGDAFGSRDVDAVLARFATDGEVAYVGSEQGESAVGGPQLRVLLTDLFARHERYSWRCGSVLVIGCAAGFGVVAEATLFVDPDVPAPGAAERESVPYRISGLLEREPGSTGQPDWRWRWCQGAEPAA